MGSTWCRQRTSQTMCHVFLCESKAPGWHGTNVWSRSQTSQLSFLPLCLQTSGWVGFQCGCKMLNGRHARLAAGQKRPVSLSLFLIRAVSFRLLKGELLPRASLPVAQALLTRCQSSVSQLVGHGAFLIESRLHGHFPFSVE